MSNTTFLQLLAEEGQTRLRLEEGSIAETALVDRLFEEFRPDVVVHAAASYKDPDDWDEDGRTNAVGTANVVQAAERGEVGRFIYFQTALCYGLHPQEQPITLAHPLGPAGASAHPGRLRGRLPRPRLRGRHRPRLDRLRRSRCAGDVYNVAGAETSIRSLAELVIKLTRSQSPIGSSTTASLGAFRHALRKHSQGSRAAGVRGAGAARRRSSADD